MKPFERILRGFFFVLKGTKAIFSIPGLFKFALIPFLIDLALLYWGFALGFTYVTESAKWVTGWLISPEWELVTMLLYYPLYVLFSLGFVVLVLYLVFVMSTIIASPFNSILAEKTLMHYKLIEPRDFNFSHWVKVSLKMMYVSAIRGVILILLGVVLLMASFIPGVNIMASFITFYIVAFDCMDYSFELMEYDLSKRFRLFKKLSPEFSGMSGFLWLGIIVPGSFLLMLPSAVVGSAVLLADIKKSNQFKGGKSGPRTNT